MRTTPAHADLQRLSEDLARNPASLAFLPLARAYRRQKRHDLALRICLRGLEQHPTNVEAHALLALLYLEDGDRARAADEWSIVLRLKPGNFEALRGMGFRYLEQNQIDKARQHLERAALIRPNDTAVQEALRLLRQRQQASGEAMAAAPPATPAPQPVAAPPSTRQPGAPAAAEPSAITEPTAAAEPTTAVEPAAPARPTQPLAGAPAPAGGVAAARSDALASDPTRLFDHLMGEGPLVGALLLDVQGLVLAGSLKPDAGGVAEDLGAIIGSAIDDAARTVQHLELGAWTGMLLESSDIALLVRPVPGDAIMVLVARSNAPTGWLLRSAHAAVDAAARYMESYV